MAKTARPLKLDLPAPAADRPVWSKVGIIGAVGFVLGVAWPKLAGVKVGPNVPGDLKPTADLVASAAAGASANAPNAPAAPPSPNAPASAAAAPAAAPEAPANKETVGIGPGKITKCWDKKNKKVADCGELQLDPVAAPKLAGLAECPSAVGLAGKISLGLEIDFEKKEVHVVKGKKEKTTMPTSTVTGIVQCAARAFANIPLEDVPHTFRHYTVQYGLTFYPPGKAPEQAEDKAAAAEGEDAAGSTTSEADANGSALVSWDTALVRKDPKDGEVVVRLVRGTKVKIVGRRNDWYKIEAGAKTGWIYRGAIGL